MLLLQHIPNVISDAQRVLWDEHIAARRAVSRLAVEVRLVEQRLADLRSDLVVAVIRERVARERCRET